MTWRISPKVLLAASIATPLGNNPGRDVNGLNADGFKKQPGRVGTLFVPTRNVICADSNEKISWRNL